MPIEIVSRESGALRRRLREISEAVDPHSARMNRFRTALKKVIVADNEDKFYRHATQYGGVDGRGVPFTRPADSTVRGWKRQGLILQLLAPHGLASRVITNFRVTWEYTGSQWRAVTGWINMPWLIYHIQGCAKGSNPKRPNWSLPRRDPSGITPKGRARVREEFARFARNLARRGS